MNKQHVTALVGLLAVAGAAFGQASPSGPSAPAQPAKPSLAGPKVPDRAGKPTLVERGIDGKVKRIDEWPALAAVRKLNLDKKTKEAVAKVEAEHAAAMDKMMSEHLLEIATVANSFQAGDTQEGLAGIRKLQRENQVLKDRTLLGQKISPLLTKEQGQEMTAMVQEYWTALVDEATEAAKAAGEKGGLSKAASSEALRLLGLDIKASYERVIGQQVKDFDALIKTLGLTGEQESRVRKVVNDSFTKAKGSSTDVKKADTFWKVWKELDQDQRAVLIQQFKGEKQ